MKPSEPTGVRAFSPDLLAMTIATIALWTRAPARWRIVPGALVGVVVATAIANLFQFPIAHVTVPSNLVSSLTLPTTTTLRLLTDPNIWAAALALAVVASAETLLCATAVDRMHSGPRTNYNRELLGQGIGNTLCGLVGALPMTAVIVRSTANVQAGARSRLSAILHGGWMLLLVALLPQVLQLIPVASLAGILVYTGYKLVNPAVVRQLYKYGRSEVAIYCVTVAAIVATDLLKGVLLGFALAVGKLLYRMSNIEIEIEDDVSQQRTLLHLRGAATFLRLADISDALERVAPGRKLHIRFEDLEYLDHAVLELLTAWEKQHSAQGGSVVVDWDALEQRYRSKANRRGSDAPKSDSLTTGDSALITASGASK